MSWPVHIFRQQYLINWKWCQHTCWEDLDYYRQIIDHMKIYLSGIFSRYDCVVNTDDDQSTCMYVCMYVSKTAEMYLSIYECTDRTYRNSW